MSRTGPTAAGQAQSHSASSAARHSASAASRAAAEGCRADLPAGGGQIALQLVAAGGEQQREGKYLRLGAAGTQDQGAAGDVRAEAFTGDQVDQGVRAGGGEGGAECGGVRGAEEVPGTVAVAQAEGGEGRAAQAAGESGDGDRGCGGRARPARIGRARLQGVSWGLGPPACGQFGVAPVGQQPGDAVLGRGRPEHERPAQFQRLHGVGGAVALGTPQGEPQDVAGGGAGRRQGVLGAELEEDVGREQFQRLAAELQAGLPVLGRAAAAGHGTRPVGGGERDEHVCPQGAAGAPVRQGAGPAQFLDTGVEQAQVAAVGGRPEHGTAQAQPQPCLVPGRQLAARGQPVDLRRGTVDALAAGVGPGQLGHQFGAHGGEEGREQRGDRGGVDRHRLTQVPDGCAQVGPVVGAGGPFVKGDPQRAGDDEADGGLGCGGRVPFAQRADQPVRDTGRRGLALAAPGQLVRGDEAEPVQDLVPVVGGGQPLGHREGGGAVLEAATEVGGGSGALGEKGRQVAVLGGPRRFSPACFDGLREPCHAPLDASQITVGDPQVVDRGGENQVEAHRPPPDRMHRRVGVRPHRGPVHLGEVERLGHPEVPREQQSRVELGDADPLGRLRLQGEQVLPHRPRGLPEAFDEREGTVPAVGEVGQQLAQGCEDRPVQAQVREGAGGVGLRAPRVVHAGAQPGEQACTPDTVPARLRHEFPDGVGHRPLRRVLAGHRREPLRPRSDAAVLRRRTRSAFPGLARERGQQRGHTFHEGQRLLPRRQVPGDDTAEHLHRLAQLETEERGRLGGQGRVPYLAVDAGGYEQFGEGAAAQLGERVGGRPAAVGPAEVGDGGGVLAPFGGEQAEDADLQQQPQPADDRRPRRIVLRQQPLKGGQMLHHEGERGLPRVLLDPGPQLVGLADGDRRPGPQPGGLLLAPLPRRLLRHAPPCGR